MHEKWIRCMFADIYYSKEYKMQLFRREDSVSKRKETKILRRIQSANSWHQQYWEWALSKIIIEDAVEKHGNKKQSIVSS